MQTKCPHCETIFRVGEEVYGRIDDRVRCGQCLGVFNAREYSLDEDENEATLIIPGIYVDGEAHTQEDSAALDLNKIDVEEEQEASIGDDLDASYDFQVDTPSFEEELPEYQAETFDVSMETDDVESSVVRETEADSDDAEPAFHFPDDLPVDSDTSLADFSLPDFDALEADEKESVSEVKASAEVDALLAEQDQPDAISAPIEPEQAEPTPVPAYVADDVVSRATKNTDAVAQIAAEQTAVAAEAENDTLPAFARRPQLPWGWLSLTLLVVLALQLMVWQRDTLATQPYVGSIVKAYCRFTGCEIKPPRDVAKIELLERNVYTHPKLKGALIISMSMVNRAGFAQPYPRVQISMANMLGRTVAQRVLQPTDYLDVANASETMPPGATIAVSIEVMDPGVDAQTFELSFL